MKQSHKDISLKKYICIDKSNGPIIIKDNAMSEPFVYLKGPLYIGSKSIILSYSQIVMSPFRPCTKIKEEVYKCVFQGYSNKVHGGYMGDSFIGEWVHIGTGSTFSNLRNDYEAISMQINYKYINSKKIIFRINYR